MDVEDKRNAQNVDTEEAVVAKTIDEEEETEAYPSIQIHQIEIYEPICKGRRYKYCDRFLNFEETLEHMMTDSEKIGHILEIIMA